MWLQCKHCQQYSMIIMDKEEWCYKCGYDNDLRYPIRHPNKKDNNIDYEALRESVAFLGDDYTPEGRPRVDPVIKAANRKAYNIEYQRQYRRLHGKELNARQREKYSAYHNGIHYGLGTIYE